MTSLLLVMGAFLVLATALWYGRLCRDLRLLQNEMRTAWNQLREALQARRELVPYLIAALDCKDWPEAEVLGNACDLASNVSGVMETAEAEARLDAILERLQARVEAAPSGAGSPAGRWLRQLQSANLYVSMMAGSYNQHAEAFNQRRRRLPAVLAAWCAVDTPAVPYRAAE